MAKIEHIVVLMLENRSFDHIFGFRPGINGLQGTEFNLLDPSRDQSASNPAFKVKDQAPYAVLAGKGPAHSLNATNYQLYNSKSGPGANSPPTNIGFVRNYVDELRNDHVPTPNPDTIRVVMRSFAPGRLASINALADAFCICDNWHAEVPGPTQPNRLYMHAATSTGYALNNWKRTFDVPTIYNRVADAGLTWSSYYFDNNEILEFSQVNQNRDSFRLYEESFKQDIQNNTLANYSFIIPRFMNSRNAGGISNGLANSQHAPEDARYADNLIAEVYDTLRSNDALWKKSVLIVTYDEHGGFYDHVVPPSTNVANPDGLTSPGDGDPSFAPTFDFKRLGIRVPAVIASPWVKAGRVDSTLYQHTSVLATLRKTFNLGDPLTERDKNANSFEALFDELNQPRDDAPNTLPRTDAPPLTLLPDDPAHPANQPLTEDQRDMLMRVFHLTQPSQSPSFAASLLPVTQGDAHDFIRASYRRHFG